MLRHTIISSIIASTLSGCPINSNAEEGYIYSLNEKNHQYHVYDSVTKCLIFNSAYELKYNYDTDEYSMIIPLTDNNTITDETVFTEFSFKKDEVIIIDSENGEQVNPGSMK